jgi:hypothetical protein
MVTPLYDVTGHPLLGEDFAKLKSDDARAAQNAVAELLLGLVAPAYTDATVVDQLKLAVARQINFQLQQGMTASVMRTMNQTRPGVANSYRDRYADAGALAIVAAVTDVAAVRFEPMGRGA